MLLFAVFLNLDVVLLFLLFFLILLLVLFRDQVRNPLTEGVVLSFSALGVSDADRILCGQALRVRLRGTGRGGALELAGGGANGAGSRWSDRGRGRSC